MIAIPGRRRFLKGVLGGVAGLSLSSAGLVAPSVLAARATPSETPLGNGLHLIAGAGGNVVVFATADGVALVDSGSADHTDVLLQTVRQRSGGRAADVVFNTHWHPDHTGGNEAFAQAGARIIAHENTRLWMSAPVYLKWQHREYPARAPAALPTDTFRDADPLPREVMLGDSRIEYAYLRPAYTDGDIYVHFPGSNVLAAGRAVSAEGYPVMDYSTGGWIGGMMEALQTLLAIADDDTRVVPAAGPVQTRQRMQAQYDMLATLRERVEERMRRGMSAEDMLTDGVTREFDETWGDPTLFMHNLYQGLWWRASGTI